MNAATFLSFASLLALPLMSEAAIGRYYGNRNISWIPSTATEASQIFRDINPTLHLGAASGHTVFLPSVTVNKLITQLWRLLPKSNLNLSLKSIQVPSTRYPITSIKFRQNGKDTLDLTFQVGEIVVDFTTRHCPQKRPRCDLQYSIRKINIELETIWSTKKNPQSIESASIKLFSPTWLKARYSVGTTVLLSKDYAASSLKDVTDSLRGFFPSGFKNGQFVKDLAINVFKKSNIVPATGGASGSRS